MMEHQMEGSACGRYIYGIIIQDGEEIDRYLIEDRMEACQ